MSDYTLNPGQSELAVFHDVHNVIWQEKPETSPVRNVNSHGVTEHIVDKKNEASKGMLWTRNAS